LVSSTAAACAWRQRGARYIAFTLESMIRDSARAALAIMREFDGTRR